MNALAQRPAPEQISFAPECFEVVGTETIYTVLSGFGHNTTTTDKAEADAIAARRGRPVHVEQRNILRRVRWN